MTVTVRVYYDFASTLCYVAHRVLGDVEGRIAELGVELRWCPVDLTMAVPWDRGDSFTDEIRETVARAASTLGVPVQMPDPWLDSRPASHVALRTSSADEEQRWRSAVYDEIFEHDSTELSPRLVSLAEELTGPDPLPEDDDYALVSATTREAMTLGVTGVPTLLLDHLMFGGIYDGDTMVQVVTQLLEQYRDTGASIVN